MFAGCWRRARHIWRPAEDQQLRHQHEADDGAEKWTRGKESESQGANDCVVFVRNGIPLSLVFRSFLCLLMSPQKSLQNLQDASDDLMMLDDDALLVPYQIGEVFISHTQEETQELLEAAKVSLQRQNPRFRLHLVVLFIYPVWFCGHVGWEYFIYCIDILRKCGLYWKKLQLEPKAGSRIDERVQKSQSNTFNSFPHFLQQQLLNIKIWNLSSFTF